MPKALCLTGMVIALLLLALFLFDLVVSVLGLGWAPFSGASRVMDLVFVICAGGLGYLSWSTLREQD